MHRWLESMDGKSPIALRDRALVEVAYATGARLHELEKLDLGSLDTAYGFCRLWGKGSKERMVPLTTQALRALQVYLKKGRPVLLRGREGITALWIGNRQGSPLKAQALAYLVTRRAAKAGLTLTTHTIRRAFATHLLRGGAHIVHIKDMLGHTRYRHLRHYLRLSASDVSDTLRKSKPGRR